MLGALVPPCASSGAGDSGMEAEGVGAATPMAGPDSSRSPLSPGSPRPSESAKESKAERKARKLEKALSAKLSLSEEMERELRQARGQARELWEQVAQLQRENLSLREQLAEVQEMAQHRLGKVAELEEDLKEARKKQFIAEVASKGCRRIDEYFDRFSCHRVESDKTEAKTGADAAAGTKMRDGSSSTRAAAPARAEGSDTRREKQLKERDRALANQMEQILSTAGAGH
ncbi:uncharacterized protein LOC128851332 [Cuculus canorus]|uniref:uncharacterized protein LOC128851332 n=1 Tax=Cuculus canorus TaxID=55661 RepID=UPI0023AB25D5|nr:uncharacterized protein LOC128851332 [Cuculus canorus]